MEKGFSIIIACYNSSSLLKETIEGIAQQLLGDVKTELIIIDNASTDNTYQVAQRYCKQLLEIPYRVEKQVIKGKNAALELAYNLCQYSYILICDDDNRLKPDYIQIAYRIMEEHPEIGALGGIGYPIFEVPPPEWGKEGFACGPQGWEAGDITNERGWVYGAGSVYRLSVIRDLFNKGFKNLLGTRRNEKVDVSGEDVELCYALILMGYKIWYDECLKFDHFMPERRMQLAKYLSLKRGDGVQAFTLGIYEKTIRKENMKISFLFLQRYWLIFLFKNCLFLLLNILRFRRDDLLQKAKIQSLLYACKTACDIVHCTKILRGFYSNYSKINHQ